MYMLKFNFTIFAYALVTNKIFHKLLLFLGLSYHQYNPSVGHQSPINLFTDIEN